MRQRHELRPLVDGRQEAVEIEAQPARIVRDGDHLRAEPLRQAVVDVAHRRELAVDDHHAVARPAVVERGEDDRFRRGHVGQHDHRAARRADQRRDDVAHFDRHQPPLVAPGAHAARRPEIGVLLQRISRRLGHRAEGVRDEVLRSLQDGEAIAEAEERISSSQLQALSSQRNPPCARPES